MRAIAIVALFLVLGLVMPAHGDINPVLNYQGSLKDTTGAAYPDGSYQFTFTIYSDSTSGLGLWNEVQTVSVYNGLVHAYLGSVNPFDPQIFATSPLWLGIRLESESEFQPRHQIGSAIYSFIAANALTLEGNRADHFIDSASLSASIAEHESDPLAHRPFTLDASEIVSGTIAPERLPIIAVDSTNLVDLGISGNDLADSSIGSGKLRQGSVGSNQLQDNSVTSSSVSDGTLQGADLQDSTITGDKIAQGSIEAEHLSFSAFDGSNIVDESLTGADIADSSITGEKIAAGSITSTHLSSITITGAQIADNSVSGADIVNGSIGFNDIGGSQITSFHIADGSITSSDLSANAISGAQVQDESLTGADLASNTIIDRHLVNNMIAADKTSDEPGIAYTSGGIISSVGVNVVNWMSVTINAPATGVILVLMDGVASLQGNEIAQMSISTSPSTFGSYYGEARIVTPTAIAGGNLTISISQIINVVSAGPITIYGNVRTTALSPGTVDFIHGKLEAIYFRTTY